jgi:hypothetical protein
MLFAFRTKTKAYRRINGFGAGDSFVDPKRLSTKLTWPTFIPVNHLVFHLVELTAEREDRDIITTVAVRNLFGHVVKKR